MLASKLIWTVTAIIFAILSLEEYATFATNKSFKPFIFLTTYVFTRIGYFTPMFAHSASFYFCFFSFSQITPSFQFGF